MYEKIRIPHHCLPNSVYPFILPHACWKSPERTSLFSVIPLNFSSWNMICLGQKEPIRIQFCTTFEYSNESSPNSFCHFWKRKVKVYSNFPLLFVSWKITSLYSLSSKLIYFEQKDPIEVKLLDFWVVGWKFTEFLRSYLKPQISFSLNFYHSLVWREVNLLYFSSWNLMWFG